MLPERQLPGNRPAAGMLPENQAPAVELRDVMPRFPQPYTARLIGRVALLWLLIRVIVIALAALLASGPIIYPNVRMALVVVATVAVLIRIDLKVTKEDILRANLGVSLTQSLTIASALAFLLEAALFLLLTLVD